MIIFVGPIAAVWNDCLSLCLKRGRAFWARPLFDKIYKSNFKSPALIFSLRHRGIQNKKDSKAGNTK